MADTEKDGKRRELKNCRKGLASIPHISVQLWIECLSCESVHKFPIDSMHLLYLNIAKEMLSIWTSPDTVLRDSVYLSEQDSFRVVEDFMVRSGREWHWLHGATA